MGSVKGGAGLSAKAGMDLCRRRCHDQKGLRDELKRRGKGTGLNQKNRTIFSTRVVVFAEMSPSRTIGCGRRKRPENVSTLTAISSSTGAEGKGDRVTRNEERIRASSQPEEDREFRKKTEPLGLRPLWNWKEGVFRRDSVMSLTRNVNVFP